MNILLKTALALTGLSAALPLQAAPRAVIDTNMGQIELLLNEQKAPQTVANFVRYAEQGFYNDTIFHRVIDRFMIQGGGFTADMIQKPTGKAIVNEANNGLKNTVGTVAMARLSDPHSATSQFFINIADNDFLNFKNTTPKEYGYTVFGKVTSGMDVVQNIAKVPTATRGLYQNVPVKPVIVRKITIIH